MHSNLIGKTLMSRFTYNEAISTNATHETCESKLLLFSSFVFDDWHNDMPIAWIITSRQQEEKFIDWRGSLHSNITLLIKILHVSLWIMHHKDM